MTIYLYLVGFIVYLVGVIVGIVAGLYSAEKTNEK